LHFSVDDAALFAQAFDPATFTRDLSSGMDSAMSPRTGFALAPIMRSASCVRALLLIAAGAALAGSFAAAQSPPQTAEKAPDTIEERVRACVPCHGERGQGINKVHFPPLAGKPAGYVFNQLVAFREGRRKYTPMNYLLAYLPDPYLRDMGQYYATQRPMFATPARPIVSAEVLARGEDLAKKGERVPACVACHGPELTGREPGIPGLVGLPAEYISAQLGAWRYGTRTAIAPDCMQTVASSLNEAEVAAVAAWIASLPAPSNSAPLKEGPARLPLTCGSQQR
jgi:cytochrome c553